MAIGLIAALVLGFGVYALVSQPQLLVHPNARSSHEQPTPTMGGAAIVVVVLAYLLTLTADGAAWAWGWIGMLIPLALVGLWDDLAGLSARVRMVVHVAAVVGASVVLQLHVAVPVWAWVVLVVALVWFLNLFNFMDGIDGIAGAQCMVFCVGVQLVAGGVPGWSGDLLWLLAGATLGFLAFNWPPARIFMGDVGSGFLGLLIGALAVYFWQENILPLIASLILLTAFWFDATYTLCVRILTGQEFTQAHRQHLYQRLARRRGHLWTTAAFVLYASIWLLPLAFVATRFPDYQYIALLAAVLPVAVACKVVGAGSRPSEELTH